MATSHSDTKEQDAKSPPRVADYVRTVAIDILAEGLLTLGLSGQQATLADAVGPNRTTGMRRHAASCCNYSIFKVVIT